jgi:hypothetical protein
MFRSLFERRKILATPISSSNGSTTCETGRSCAMARCRKGGAGGGGACEGETSRVGGVRVPEGSRQGSLKGSSIRSTPGTTVKEMQS